MHLPGNWPKYPNSVFALAITLTHPAAAMQITKQNKPLALFTLGVVAIVSLVMVYLTGLIPALGIWYSYDQAFP